MPVTLPLVADSGTVIHRTSFVLRSILTTNVKAPYRGYIASSLMGKTLIGDYSIMFAISVLRLTVNIIVRYVKPSITTNQIQRQKALY